VNGVLGWWWPNTSVSVRPPSGAGPLLNGDVLIAVRQVYPGQQRRTLALEVVEDTKRSVGKVVPRTQHVDGYNCRSDSRTMFHAQAYESVGERVCTG